MPYVPSHPSGLRVRNDWSTEDESATGTVELVPGASIVSDLNGGTECLKMAGQRFTTERGDRLRRTFHAKVITRPQADGRISRKQAFVFDLRSTKMYYGDRAACFEL